MSSPITPTFVLPYKRYDLATLLELSRRYTEDDQASYRGVESQISPGYYTAPDVPQSGESRGLDHMTVWRTISWLGSQLMALTLGRQHLLQHDPRSLCHRFPGAVAPQKFRSPQRQRALQTSRQLLRLIDEWEQHFDEPLFPRFATRAGFG